MPTDRASPPKDIKLIFILVSFSKINDNNKLIGISIIVTKVLETPPMKINKIIHECQQTVPGKIRISILLL